MNRLNVRIRTRLFQSLLRQEQGFFDVTRSGMAPLPSICLLPSRDQAAACLLAHLAFLLRFAALAALQTFFRLLHGHIPSACAGDITSRLSADTTTVADQVCLNLNVFLRSLTQAVVVLYFMFAASWRLTTVSFVLVPVTIVVSKVYGSWYRYDIFSCWLTTTDVAAFTGMTQLISVIFATAQDGVSISQLYLQSMILSTLSSFPTWEVMRSRKGTVRSIQTTALDSLKQQYAWRL